ncbi:hypothetical protein C8J57DRAFT_1324636 [Mycena rebaudengoi]|nr:hypothetical protein C8J57DRAFT_1324636 [Mycena rebaudengoi]
MDARILIGVKDYVFDVTVMEKEYFGQGKPYAQYAWQDISCALAKYSTRKQDIDVNGYTTLSPSELQVLDGWAAIFLKRFEAVGRLVSESG